MHASTRPAEGISAEDCRARPDPSCAKLMPGRKKMKQRRWNLGSQARERKPETVASTYL